MAEAKCNAPRRGAWGVFLGGLAPLPFFGLSLRQFHSIFAAVQSGAGGEFFSIGKEQFNCRANQ
jgi:hypothetical protein